MSCKSTDISHIVPHGKTLVAAINWYTTGSILRTILYRYLVPTGIQRFTCASCNLLLLYFTGNNPSAPTISLPTIICPIEPNKRYHLLRTAIFQPTYLQRKPANPPSQPAAAGIFLKPSDGRHLALLCCCPRNRLKNQPPMHPQAQQCCAAHGNDRLRNQLSVRPQDPLRTELADSETSHLTPGPSRSERQQPPQ